MTHRNLLLGAAVSGLLAATAMHSQNQPGKPSDQEMGKCFGVNTCKGKGECGSKDHSCAGLNSCTGKGWLKMTMKDCAAKKGKFEK